LASNVNKSINCNASAAYKHLFLREILSAPTRSSSNEYPFNSVFKVPTLLKVLEHTIRPFEVPSVVDALVFEVPLVVVVEALVVVVVVVVMVVFELTQKEWDNLRSQITTSSWGGQIKENRLIKNSMTKKFPPKWREFT
jgi:uncharacterized membrane protein